CFEAVQLRECGLQIESGLNVIDARSFEVGLRFEHATRCGEARLEARDLAIVLTLREISRLCCEPHGLRASFDVAHCAAHLDEDVLLELLDNQLLSVDCRAGLAVARLLANAADRHTD